LLNIRVPLSTAEWREEGSRFPPAMQGSGVYVGRFDLETELNKTDVNGLVLRDELEKIGYLGDDDPGSRNVGAFFETHIEQGPILEDEDKTIGVLRLGQGIRWYTVTITGRESHAGTTPMHLRADAMLAASKVVCEIDNIALSNAPNGLGTTGFMEVYPNSRNTIAGTVTFSADLRNPNPEVLAQMDERFQNYCKQLAKDSDVKIDVDHFWYFAPVEFSASNNVEIAAKKLGYSHMDIYAGAGHDACYMADLVPTGMVFTPCLRLLAIWLLNNVHFCLGRCLGNLIQSSTQKRDNALHPP
jgi:N-carbamoyl-L-amino-acid hydrolase